MISTESEFQHHLDTFFSLTVGNPFELDLMSERVARAIKNKTPNALYLGFNPASYQGDIVVLTDDGYVFVPLKGRLALAGDCWSHLVFIRLYFAQERLSSFLEELGKRLNIKVIDRCLFIEYLDHNIFAPEDLTYLSKEEIDFYTEKQASFRDRYKQQLEERGKFESWIEYHNQGFAYRYLPSMEMDNAIDAIYRHRDIFEENNYWQEARAVIDHLRDFLMLCDPIRVRTEEDEIARQQAEESRKQKTAEAELARFIAHRKTCQSLPWWKRIFVSAALHSLSQQPQPKEE